MAALEAALANGQFVLHYQPIFVLSTRRVIGVEALVRWQQPERLVPPDDFLPVAEATGFITTLGDWALREAARQLLLWDEGGLRLNYVSVNVSPVQLQDDAYADSVLAAITDTGIEPGRVLLEITESVSIADAERAAAALNWLARVGARVALDDFGTGSSNLASFQRLPLAVLKIDRSFVNHIMESARDRSIVQFVTGLAKANGLATVAEGIETQEQLDVLTGLGGDYGQGWLVSKALAPDALLTAFESGRLVANSPTRQMLERSERFAIERTGKPF
ncbi:MULTISPECIES: EAL domain-containing protein [unclassified Variovorax]|nr:MULTISPECIES: EAL domain-containing protein [unclassified Variovorax]PNG50132.1 Phytochrome-like protein cph2 [Variovorax sp. B2]PNG51005.1 Phytochrome-like protein cph2 [Variovorax sp. B4]VTU42031.1 Bacteriophytochrome cph2 [Variovorax sp. PBL-E5]VTU44448.1 Bacteriophytochrome cph2 [Variovorax sp. PBL-H6]